jgi:hypothetical protein
MKRDKKYESAAFGSFFGMVGIVVLCLGLVITNHIPSCNTETQPPTEGIPHNYYHPDVWGHDTSIDLSYPDEDVMWIGGDGDTIWE